MARTEGRIYTMIWRDEDFLALAVPEQWLYFALLTQPDLSMCGVLPDAPGRWGTLSKGTKRQDVVRWRTALQEARFIVRDDRTEEVLLRTFVRRDDLLRAPNLVVSMARAFGAVHSQLLRDAIVEELAKVFPEGILEGLLERFPHDLKNPKAKPFLERLPKDFVDAVHGPCIPSFHHSVIPSLTALAEISSSNTDARRGMAG